MLPFFEKYPYTNFEQLNLDKLMSEFGRYTEAINELNSAVSSLDTRVTTAEGDITALKGRMTDAEGDISSLKGRMSDAEGDITSLKGRMTDAEDDITSLKGRVSTNEFNISGIDGRLTSTESTVSGLVSAVADIPIVTANPGGTGTALNSIGIDGTTYTIQGGGGGGSSVTPNPSGTPTADLDTVDIDGTIYAIAGGGTTVVANPGGTDNPDLTSVSIAGTAYDIPVTDVTALETAVDNLEDDMDTVEGKVSTLESATAFLADGISDIISQSGVTVGNSSVGNNIDSDPYTLAAGTYLLVANCNLAITSGSSSYSWAEVRNSIIGLPTSARADVEGYIYTKAGALNQNIVSIFTLSAATNITLRTLIRAGQFQVPNGGALYNYVRVIKLR